MTDLKLRPGHLDRIDSDAVQEHPAEHESLRLQDAELRGGANRSFDASDIRFERDADGSYSLRFIDESGATRRATTDPLSGGWREK